MSTDSTRDFRIIRGDVPVDVFSFMIQVVIERNTATEDYLAEHLEVAARNLNAVVEDVVVVPMSDEEVGKAFPLRSDDILVNDAFAPVDFGPERFENEREVATAFLDDGPAVRAELIVTTPEGHKTSSVVEYDPPVPSALRRVVLGTAINDVVRGVRATLALDEVPAAAQGGETVQDGARFNGMRIEDMARTEVNVVLYHDPEVDITQGAMVEALSTISHIQLVTPAA